MRTNNRMHMSVCAVCAVGAVGAVCAVHVGSAMHSCAHAFSPSQEAFGTSIVVINQCTYSIAVINQCAYSIAVINPPSQEAFGATWDFQIGTILNAQVHTAAWSGLGMVHNCCGGNTTMPAIFSRTLATKNVDNTWDWSSWYGAR
jgi:hypothetical protein